LLETIDSQEAEEMDSIGKANNTNQRQRPLFTIVAGSFLLAALFLVLVAIAGKNSDGGQHSVASFVYRMKLIVQVHAHVQV